MSYYAYDSNGYVGDVGSNTGWKSLCDYLMDNGNPASKSLCRDGWSDGIDFRDIPEPEDKVLLGLYSNLKEIASRCEEVLIVSQGFEEGQNED